ncbi:hypothetical protein L1987_50578 [Smallanthus sonchifolius]|uniref:Uncharacterized protein n=1 Tax=Smallanthus sonchifolius TaxID=185202 RepID=A0ACB9EMW8_9ASTR|nr:hypothetical protein L1987_50578 [Smallanthus sonchifolius]
MTQVHQTRTKLGFREGNQKHNPVHKLGSPLISGLINHLTIRICAIIFLISSFNRSPEDTDARSLIFLISSSPRDRDARSSVSEDSFSGSLGS